MQSNSQWPCSASSSRSYVSGGFPIFLGTSSSEYLLQFTLSDIDPLDSYKGQWAKVSLSSCSYFLLDMATVLPTLGSRDP